MFNRLREDIKVVLEKDRRKSFLEVLLTYSGVRRYGGIEGRNGFISTI